MDAVGGPSLPSDAGVAGRGMAGGTGWGLGLPGRCSHVGQPRGWRCGVSNPAKGGLRFGELQDGAVRFAGRCARLRTENHLLHVRACWWKKRWTGVKRAGKVGRSAVVSSRMLSQGRRRSMPWGRRIGSRRSAPSACRSTGRFYLGRVRPELELESDRGIDASSRQGYQRVWRRGMSYDVIATRRQLFTGGSKVLWRVESPELVVWTRWSRAYGTRSRRCIGTTARCRWWRQLGGEHGGGYPTIERTYERWWCYGTDWQPWWPRWRASVCGRGRRRRCRCGRYGSTTTSGREGATSRGRWQRNVSAKGTILGWDARRTQRWTWSISCGRTCWRRDWDRTRGAPSGGRRTHGVSCAPLCSRGRGGWQGGGGSSVERRARPRPSRR